MASRFVDASAAPEVIHIFFVSDVRQRRGPVLASGIVGAEFLRIPVDRDRAFRFNVTEDSEFA
jgi:hypothetical protein